MKRAITLTLLAVAAFGVGAEPLMKAGLWDMRVVKHVADGKDMSAQMAASQAKMQEMLAKMTPQQRQQMEQMMGKAGGAGSEPGATRICISPEMAARDRPVMPKDSNCEVAKFNRSGDTATFEMNCKRGDTTMVGKGQSQRSGDTVTNKMDMVTTDAKGRHVTQMESQMKFVSANCGGIKPIDQLAREMQGEAAAAKKAR